jgi:serine/tyrosine/threonine adenylyltransferase
MFNKKINIDHIGFKLENSYTHLPKQMFAVIEPVKVVNPKLVVFNQTLASSMGLNFSRLPIERKLRSFPE